MSYREETQERSGSAVIRPECNLAAFRPRWYIDGGYLESVIRPIGPTAQGDTEFLPWRSSPEARSFTDWITSGWLWFGGSKNKVELLLKQYNEDGTLRNQEIDPNPFYRLQSVLRQARNAGDPAAVRLMARRGKSPPDFSTAAQAAFIQGLVFYRGNERLLAKTKLPYKPRARAVMVLKSSARQAMEVKLDAVRPGAADPTNFADFFEVGDLLSPEQGKMLVVMPENAGQNHANTGAAVNLDVESHGGGYANETRSDSGKMDTEGYRVAVEPGPLPRDPQTGQIKICKVAPFVPWRQVLRTFTDQEIALALCLAFGDRHEHKAFLFQAWQDTPEVLPQDRWSWLTAVKVTTPPPAPPVHEQAGYMAPPQYPAAAPIPPQPQPTAAPVQPQPTAAPVQPQPAAAPGVFDAPDLGDAPASAVVPDTLPAFAPPAPPAGDGVNASPAAGPAMTQAEAIAKLHALGRNQQGATPPAQEAG